MQIEGWMITSGFVILTGAFNYVIFRTGVYKDIAAIIKRADKHSERLDNVDTVLTECVKKGDCKEDRQAYEKTADRIEQTIIRLEQKFDAYIQDGRSI